MGKLKTYILNYDMTFEEENVKTSENKLEMDDDWTPSFSPGASVFTEKIKKVLGIIPRWWAKPKRIAIILDGASEAFKIETPQRGPQKPSLIPTYWTRKEETNFVKKVVMKSAAEIKPLTMWQFAAILVVLGFIAILQLLAMRGVRLV